MVGVPARRAAPHTDGLLGLAVSPLSSPGVAQPDQVRSVESLEHSRLPAPRGGSDCLRGPVGRLGHPPGGEGGGGAGARVEADLGAGPAGGGGVREGVVRLSVGRLGVAGLVAVQILAPRGGSSLGRAAGGLERLARLDIGLVGDDVDPHPHVGQSL